MYQSITPWEAQVYKGEGSQLTEALEMWASNSAFCTRNVGKASKGEACVTVSPEILSGPPWTEGMPVKGEFP